MLRLELLHCVARIALRVRTPRDAKRITDSVGRLIADVSSVDEARRTAVVLDRKGTCLSRALTLSALVPSSEVVIGVDPNEETALPLFAHAWVEVRHEPIRPTDVRGVEIARMGRVK